MLKICLKLKKGCHRIIIFTLACLKMTLNETYHFYGNKNNNTENFRNLKLYKEIESFYLLINDQVKVQNIDFDKKIISILQTGTNGRAIFKGKNIQLKN